MRKGYAFLFCLFSLPLCTCAADNPPAWVKEIAARSVPVFDGKVPAIVLLDEQHATIDATGKVTIAFRRALKILNQEGRKEAEAVIPYLSGSVKVKELHAWLIAPSGYVKTYGKDRVQDIGAVTEALYDELRIRAVHAKEPEVGSVFAYEAELETTTVFTQDEYDFQATLPVSQARYVLSLPPGWTAVGVVFNHSPMQPVVEGSTYTWELRDLELLDEEREAPSRHSLVPWLGVSFFPPEQTQGSLQSIKSWTDVSVWLTALIAGQDEINGDISAKARELTASATSEYQKVQAIGKYVQDLKYVSIQMNLARGGGYRPHSAPVVFQKRYGDCKDKATLMRALLKSIGIQSYLLVLNAGDRTFVREEWPSPRQFNHAIVAIRVSDETKAPTIIKHPELGRLLIFDPTSVYTPVGDLPCHEQGSLALVIAGQNGALMRLPATPPESNLTEVLIEGSINDSGALKAVVTSTAHGQSAVAMRARFDPQNAGENQKLFEHWVNHSGKTVQVKELEIRDLFSEQRFNLRAELEAGSYGQLMQGRLLVFNPSVVSGKEEVLLSEEKRTAPILLNAETYHEKIRIKLPANFTVDEIPDNGALNTSFGHFACTYKVDRGQLLVDRELKTEAVTLPAEEYTQAQKFFATVAGAVNQSVVLVRNSQE